MIFCVFFSCFFYSRTNIEKIYQPIGLKIHSFFAQICIKVDLVVKPRYFWPKKDLEGQINSLFLFTFNPKLSLFCKFFDVMFFTFSSVDQKLFAVQKHARYFWKRYDKSFQKSYCLFLWYKYFLSYEGKRKKNRNCRILRFLRFLLFLSSNHLLI